MEASGDQDHFKYIPFRLYVEEGYKQKLIKPVTDDGRRKTLQEFLQELFPEKTNGSLEHYSLIIVYLFVLYRILVKVKTHGMIPPLDTPIQWMSEHLSYPDNFLHLCLT